jgi:hypothetical protein
LTAGSNVTIVPGAGTITINAGVPPITWAYTYVNSKPYTVLTSDYVLGCDNSVNLVGLELPDAPTTGSEWIVKDVGGAASPINIINVTTVSGAVLIDGAANYGIDVAYGSAKFTFNGVGYIVG